MDDRLYSFVMRGELAKVAIKEAGIISKYHLRIF